MRLRKVKYAQYKLKSYPELVYIDPIENRGKWESVFANNNPIHLEIGIGKGKFLFELAKLFPEINFLGIEKYDSVIVRALEKLLSEPLPNVRLIYVDAEKLPLIFEKGEISHLYLNFSDPWPKNAHAKRRLTSPLFITRYQSIIAKNSIIEYKTDNYDFFEYTMMTLVQANATIQKISLDLHKEKDITNVETEFETKFVAMGNAIFYIRFQIKE